ALLWCIISDPEKPALTAVNVYVTRLSATSDCAKCSKGSGIQVMNCPSCQLHKCFCPQFRLPVLFCCTGGKIVPNNHFCDVFTVAKFKVPMRDTVTKVSEKRCICSQMSGRLVDVCGNLAVVKLCLQLFPLYDCFFLGLIPLKKRLFRPNENADQSGHQLGYFIGCPIVAA